MYTTATLVVILAIFKKTDFLVHVHLMMTRSCLNKWPIEKVPVVSDNYLRLHFEYVFEKSAQQGPFVRFIKYYEMSGEFWLGRKIEILYIFRDDFSICY